MLIVQYERKISLLQREILFLRQDTGGCGCLLCLDASLASMPLRPTAQPAASRKPLACPCRPFSAPESSTTFGSLSTAQRGFVFVDRPQQQCNKASNRRMCGPRLSKTCDFNPAARSAFCATSRVLVQSALAVSHACESALPIGWPTASCPGTTSSRFPV